MSTDDGKPAAERITPKQRIFVEWVTQQYAVPIDLAAHWFGVQKSQAYAITKKLVRLGQVKVIQARPGHPTIPAGKPGADSARRTGRFESLLLGPMWIMPTRSTATKLLGSDPGQWTVKPSTALHLWMCGELRLTLTGQDTRPEIFTSERLLRRQAAPSGDPDVGSPRPYCHDGVFRDDNGKRWAIEVELTRKSGLGRMVSTLQTAAATAAQLDDDISGVIYFCRGEAVKAHVQTAKDELAKHNPATANKLHIRDLDKILAGRKVVRAA